jgi:DNA end-binding protein Ku
MPARPYWKGQIRLALVSIPVELYTATKSGSSIAFNQIHEPTGKRIRQEKVVPGVGPVDAKEIVKGYEYSKGHYVTFEDDELEAVKLESKKTIDLTQFVEPDEIDPIFYEKPYYVVPADKLAEEAFIVLRDALKSTNKVAVGQLAVRGREYIVSLKPCEHGLLLETLRYADEVQQAQSYFRDIGEGKPDPELLELAESLIEKKTAKFDPSKFHDHYEEALKELIEKKLKSGHKIEAEEIETPRHGGNVLDLMALLRESVKKPGSASSSKTQAKKAPAKRARTTHKTTHARKAA